VIIQTAAERSWRIESVRWLGYAEQGRPEVRMQGIVAIQLKIEEWRAGIGDGLRTHGNRMDLQPNSGRTARTARTARTGHSDNISGVRTQGGRI